MNSAARPGAQVLERQPGQRPQVAVPLQPRLPLVLPLVLRALAGERPAEVRVAQAHGAPHEACPAAARADTVVLLRRHVRKGQAGVPASPPGSASPATPLQYLVQAL